MHEAEQNYKSQIAEILNNYVDGYDVFIKNEWDVPLKLKPNARGANLTDNWMILMECITGIIAKSKYGLDTYDNEIHILDSEQMLDVYVNTGMPDNYDHWSHGKQRVQMGEAHARGEMNLAYEMVINSDPSISYCMTSNSNAMQALVIAHAAQGHNAFFKNNMMFRLFTRANEIRADLKRFAAFVRECEVKYGIDRVERILDACHALQSHAVDYRVRLDRKKSKKQIEMYKASIEVARSKSIDTVLDTTSIKQPSQTFRSVIDEDDERPLNEQNLLRYIMHSAPHLKDWERQIIGMFCDRAQYFYPQMRTKLMNEGFASFWHYKIMHDLHNEKLISDSMMFEFLESHSSVLRQPDFARFNPYALGFAIYMDLERMCKDPTDEDRLWFPEIAGKEDWLAVHKEAAYNFHDESFIYQYLSPKVMRDFHMFSLEDDNEADFKVTAIHDDEGYKKLRANLAAMHDVSRFIPRIEPLDYDEREDRTLTLKHTMLNDKPLDYESANEVLKHIYQLWGHPVVLATIDNDEDIVDVFSCPRDIEGRALERYYDPQ